MDTQTRSRVDVRDLFDLKGKVFLVVGGARHLGLDMASALAQAGADGVLTSRDGTSAQAAAEMLVDETDQRVMGCAVDATKEVQIREAVGLCAAQFGRIDILVSNVGGGGIPSTSESVALAERRLEDWQRICALNLTAPYLIAKHVAPVMQKQRGGSIINIASIAGMIGRDRRVYVDGMAPQALDYAAVKGGVIGLTRDLAAYLGSDGVRVNAISPGGFERGQPAGFIKRYAEKTMLGRMGRDGVDLKGAALYLASDASAYVTGHNLVVDGGFSSWQ